MDVVHGIPLQVVESTDSTMDLALKMSLDGFRGIVQAYVQTNGRGMGPRSWHSPKGGLYFTWVMDYDPHDPITQFGEPLMHLAAIRTLKHYGIFNAKVDAPNDLYINQHKIGGSLKWYRRSGMLLGFGLNLHLEEGSVEGVATSIKAVSGVAPSADEALKIFVGNVLAIMRSFPKQLEELKDEWSKVQLTLPDLDDVDSWLQ